MSATEKDVKGGVIAREAKHDAEIPAKGQGFDTVSVKVDLSDCDDPAQVLVVEVFAGRQRIAHMERPGGPREQTTITGQRIADPDTLVFETGSNREHKGDITVTTTIKGADKAKAPTEVATR